MTCPTCRKENSASAKFCLGCGAKNVQQTVNLEAVTVPLERIAAPMADATIALPGFVPPQRPVFRPSAPPPDATIALPSLAPPRRSAPPAFAPPVLDATIAMPAFAPPQRPVFRPSAPPLRPPSSAPPTMDAAVAMPAYAPPTVRPQTSWWMRALVPTILIGVLGGGALLFMRGIGGGDGGSEPTEDDDEIIFVPHTSADGKAHFSFVNSEAKVVFSFAEREWTAGGDSGVNAFNLFFGLPNINTDGPNGGVISLAGLKQPFARNYQQFTNAQQETLNLDQFGGIVKSPKFKQIGRFRDGLAPARSIDANDGLCGYIDRLQNLKIPMTLEICAEFHEGLAISKEPGSTSKLQFINAGGKMVITGDWNQVNPFHNGRAQVWKDQKVGFIDKSGRVVVPIQYKSAGDFFEGLAAVREKNLVGYINSSGTMVIPQQYQSVNRFASGRAIVTRGREMSIIDKAGNAVNKIPLSYAGEAAKGQFIVRTTQSKWGLMDASGSMIVPAEFDKGLHTMGYSVFSTQRPAKLEVLGPGLHVTGSDPETMFGDSTATARKLSFPLNRRLNLRFSEVSQKLDRIVLYFESKSGNRSPDFNVGAKL